MSATAYGSGLIGTTALQNLLDIIEVEEGYGETQNGPGALYVDGVNHPTIGFGFDLTQSNVLGAVLDGLLPSGVTYVVGQTNQNVFVHGAAAAAAAQHTVESTTNVVNYFSWLITQFGTKTSAIYHDSDQLQQDLTWALQQFYAGNGYALINADANGNPLYKLPTQGVANSTIEFAFSDTDPTNAELVLQNLIIGASISEGTAGPLPITGYSPSLYGVMTRANVPLDGSGNLIGAQPNSSQWVGLVLAAFQGLPHNASKGLADNDPAQTWYILRYTSNLPEISGYAKRGMLEAQLFGLNGVSTASAATLAIQDYEMLTEHRSTIVDFESSYGVNTAHSAINNAAADSLALGTYLYRGPLARQGGVPQPLQFANTSAGYTALSLATIFNPEAQQIANMINGLYSGMLPSVGILNYSSSGTFQVLSTNILMAPDASDFSNGFSTNASEYIEADDSPTAPHILLGPDTAVTGVSPPTLKGGSGNDLIIAGAGDEALYAVSGGNDTLIGGQGLGANSGPAGNDTLLGGPGNDTFDFALPTSGALTETIFPYANQQGTLEVSKGNSPSLLGGSISAPLQSNTAQSTPGVSKVWTGPDGTTTYTYNVASEQMFITGGVLGSNSIDIHNFNLSAAESATGFMGIFLDPNLQQNVTANQGVDPPVGYFIGGSTESFTLSVDAPSTTAQNITVTLSGALASDFEVQVGDQIESIASNGTFNVTLAAGDTNVAYTLIDVTADNGYSDLAQGGTLTLSASLADSAVAGGAVQATPISLDYLPNPVEPQDHGFGVGVDGFLDDSGTFSYTDAGGNTVTVGGTFYGYPDPYGNAGGDGDFIMGNDDYDNWAIIGGFSSIVTGTGAFNYVLAGANGATDIYLRGATDYADVAYGAGTVYGGTGKDTITTDHDADAVIIGDGGTDVICTNEGTNQIYADHQVGLGQAIAQTESAARTSGQGDFISVLDGNNTVVGGTGDDLITAGIGPDVIVLGSGDDTFVGGLDVTYADADWTATTTFNGGPFNLEIDNLDGDYTLPYENPYEQPYNGSSDPDTGQPLSVSNDTVFAGNGNDVIVLGNGSNYVQGGSGNDSIFGGMGGDTIYAGSGNTVVHGGGGTTYIYGGSGQDTLRGGDGNNVIIGGSGNSTITAAHGPSANYAGAGDEQNYVFGGSGNDLITGSAGNDTLIAGSGNTTIQGGSGNESIVGGSGTDSLVAGSGNATIQAGGAGNDTLIAGTGSGSTYLLYGGTGVDSILGGSGTNQLYAGDGGTASASTSVIAGQGATTLYGGDGFDYLSGGSGTNVIYAGGGASTLVAGSGATTLYGGSGNDLIEGGSGNDVVYAGDGGSTTVIAGTGASTLYGGPGASVLQDQQGGSDLIVSVDADDTLYGTGSDTLVAGVGDDLLETDGSSGVTVQFNSGFGDDSVNPSGGSVNILFGTGIESGDFSANMEFDASGNSYLALYADGGSITIENGATGAIGSLTFADDQTDSPNLALDVAFVRADAASSGTISLGALLEDAFGGDQTFAFGSDNYFLSLQDDDSVSAGSYQDTIAAYGVNDTLVASTATSEGDSIYSAGDSASIIGGTGTDSIQAVGDDSSVLGGTGVNDVTLSGANALYTGTSGQDFITVSGTDDTVIAGTGNTEFIVNDPSAVIDVTAGSAVDSIISSVSYTAPANVDILTLTGTANISATGNAANDSLTGGAGQDTLIAGSGVDTLIGGSGNTTFVVNNTGDVVVDGYGSANNEIQSSVSYALPTDVETLVLTGTGGLSATANGGNDTIVTNTGVDTLYAGSGNDTFVINNPGDVIVAGTGTINIVDGYSGNSTLTAGSYSLTLTGTANLVGTAGPGNDTLISNSGVDTLYGGGGNDTFVINNSADGVVDTSSTSSNIAISSVSYSLPTDVNTLILIGSAALVGTGNSATNVLEANSGNDTLISGTGLTTLIGGSGNDAFYVNNSGDVVRQTVSGVSDTIVASASTSLVTNVDTLVLTGTANLSGTVSNPDNDTLVSNSGVDTFIGGSGAETYFINNSSDVVEDNSATEGSVVEASVSYTLPNLVTSLILTGTANLTGVANNDTDDVLTGNAGNDILRGGDGFDTLIAGSGVDTLVGGAAPTTFVVNNAADVVVNSYGVPDTVMSSVGYTLSTGVTALVLTGSADLIGTAVSGNNSIVGNAGNDVLQAGTGADTLIAGSGADTLIGGTGPDTFVINSAADVIESISGSSGNQIVAAINYTLPSSVDILTLTGTAALLGVGNAAADSITANIGSDTLVAGSGADTLVAGRGADLFIVNSTADVISVPFGSIGPDTIQSSVSFSLPTAVTVLQLTGTADLIGTGSQSLSEIVGNAGNDTLQAGIGNSTLVAGTGLATLIGSSGTDVFIIDNTADVVEETTNGRTNILFSSVTYTLPANVDVLNLAGSASLVATGNSDNDSMTGNAGADTLVAGSGNDTLAAGGGLDTFIAGAGNDVFIVNNAGDVIESASATGANAVVSSVSYVLPTNVNTLTFTGVGNDAGTGNAGNDLITGNGGQDTLIAGTGVDTLIGGSGAMVFVVNNTADVVTDSYSYFTSQIQSSVNYVLPTNVNELVFTGTGSLVGTANNGTDTLISNSGTDTLFGGTGTDTFVVNNSSDVIQVTATNTSDVVQSAVSYSLAAGVNTLYLTGTGNLTGTANNGNDTLVSDSGVDVLVGGTGNDTFIVNNSADVVEDTVASANNVIISSVSYSLVSDVNTLELTGTGNLVATGNAGTDLIEANSGNDTLVAGTGPTTLQGGTGNDLFVISSSADVVQVGTSGANDTIDSSVSFTLPTATGLLQLTGSGNLVGKVSTGNDTLVSNSGVDTLIAGTGPDLIIVNNASDVVQNVTAGDTIESSGNFTLNVSGDLVLLGTAALTATGNASGDTLIAGAGADTLVANTPNQTLIGGSGNDTFEVSDPSDVVIDTSSTTSNVIVSSISYSLPADVDALTSTGTNANTLTGNQDFNNTLTGSSGSDTLIGTAFNNTLVGSSGFDYTTGAIYGGPGTNVIYASNGESENVYGASTVDGAAPQNTIYGGNEFDYLYGGQGSDLIEAGTGYTTVQGGSGSETIYGSSGRDILIGGSGSNVIYGSTGTTTIDGGSGSNTLYGGSGATLINAGSGTNVLYAGTGGSISTAVTVNGGALGTNASTQTTIYGGSGVDYLLGGPGSDAIYAGSGSLQYIRAGTGSDTLYGYGSGNVLQDYYSGLSLLVAGGGAETLQGYGGDTLQAGSGDDVLYDQTASVTGSVYEFNPGFGQATVGDGAARSDTVATSLNDTLDFGSGITASNLTFSQSVIGGNYSDYSLALIINDGTSSIEVDGGIVPGTINTVEIGGVTESFTQFMNSLGTGVETVGSGGLTSEVSTGDGQLVTDAGSRDWWAVWAFGNDDVINDTAAGAPEAISAFGNNDTVSAYGGWYGGSDDVINLGADNFYGASPVTIAGANDTVNTASTSFGDIDFIVSATSDVIDVVVPGQYADSVDALASFTLPTNVGYLTLDSRVAGLSGTSNAQGGELIAAGNYDTLTGGAGHDTLYAQGSNDVLVGGSGSETYVLANSTDTVVFGSGAPSTQTVDVNVSYTLPTAANILVETGTSALAVGNAGNDLIEATGVNDTVVAGTGNDTLQAGGTSNVTLVGNSATDTFWVSHAGDVIVDTAPGANDVLVSSVSYSLPSYISVMTLTGPAAIVATANNANDSITASTGNDTLVAGTGNDTLVAGTAADTFEINSGFGDDVIANANSGDIIQFGAGIAASSLTFTAVPGTAGSALSLVISGDGGAITVQGGLVPGALSAIEFSGGVSDTVPQLVAPNGPVTVAGSGGNLILLPGSSASVSGGSGDDTIIGWGSADTLDAGSGGALIYAGGANDVATGSSASDTLVGIGSAATLDGGTGTETFIVNNTSTTIQALAGGQNTLLTSVNYTLPTNITSMILTGTANLQATGNSASDVITANSGADTLTGGTGVATLVGGSGPDVFVVTNTGDVIQNPYGVSNDTLVADANFTLPIGITAMSISSGVYGVAAYGNNQNDVLASDGTQDSLYAGGGNDALVSYGQEGALVAGSGNDYLYSEDGFTTMVSGTGVDTLKSTWEYDSLVINNSADVIQSLAAYDSIYSSVNYTLPSSASQATYPLGFDFIATGSANLTLTNQSFLPDTLNGNSGDDVLIGGSGYNEFVDQHSSGGDTFVGGVYLNNFIAYNPGDVVIAQPGSTDTLQADYNVTLSQYIDTLFLFGPNHYGVANSGNDTLQGNSVSLYGGSGNDSFWSEGYVTMVAGSGSDTMTSSNDADVIVLNQGFSAVDVNLYQYGSHAVGPIVEFGTGESSANLTASTDASGDLLITDGSGTVTLQGALGSSPYRFEFGNSGPTLSIGQFLSEVNLVSSTVAGSTGNVVFDGTAGTSVTGGTGNDTLAVAAAADTIVAGSGAQYLEAFGVNDSVIGGSGADSAFAYGSGDTIVSGSTSSTSFLATVSGANDVLIGGSGGDVLNARGVGDTLISGTALQDLYSTQGQTTFEINNSSDYLDEESPTTGNVLLSSVSFSLPSFVDTLILTGSGSDSAVGNSDNDLMESNAGSDTLTAGSGTDTLIAGSGPARLVGGSGADLFIIDSTADVVTVSGSHGADTIQSSVSFTLPTGINTLVLSGNGLTGTANASADLIVGSSSGTDTLAASGSAATTLEGGGGNNQFNVTGTRDVVVENNTGVNDLILSTVSYTLAPNVNALTLSGTGPLLASAGTWGGVLTAASSGTDTLSAGQLVSTLVGGGANDVFVVDNTADVVTVSTAGLVDTIQSSVSYSLPTNVTKLTFTGSSAVYGIANGLNDTLTANSGNDTLQAGGGTDELVGGTGADLFMINSTADIVSVSGSHGVDTVQSSVTYSLPSSVLDLVLSGTASINGTGSSATGGIIQANSGTDVLTGVGAATTLYGGAGNDTFAINSTTDVVIDSYTSTTNILNSSVSFTLPTNVNILNVTGASAVLAVSNGGNDSITANTAADTLVGAGSGSDTLVSGSTGADSLVGGTGADVFVVKSTSDIVSVSTANTNDTIQSAVSYSLPTNVQYLVLTGTATVTGSGNGTTDLIVANSGTDTLTGGTGIAVLEGGSGHDTLRAASNQAALIAGSGAASLSGGTFRDFLAAGSGSDTIVAGATANVIAVNKGDGATVLTPTTVAGAADVLSLGAGIDTESLSFTKSGNNLILNDGVTGDSITLTNYLSGSADQNVKTLQVVEIASSSYNGSGTDPLENQALEEFNFSALVTAFTNAGSSAGWLLSKDMASAQLTSSSSADYGGDLAYYYGLNGNLTGLNLSAAQATLTNSSFATATQTIDSWSSISGGSGGLHLLTERPPAYVDPTQLAWLSADASAHENTPVLGSDLETGVPYEATTPLPLTATPPVRRTIDTPRTHLE